MVKRTNMNVSYSLTLRPLFEQVDTQGYVIGYYNLPIDIMNDPRLVEIVEQSLYGFNVEAYTVDSRINRLIVQVTPNQDFRTMFPFIGSTNEVIKYLNNNFNTEIKEDTWRAGSGPMTDVRLPAGRAGSGPSGFGTAVRLPAGKEGDTSFQFKDVITGKMIDSFLDLIADEIKVTPPTRLTSSLGLPSGMSEQLPSQANWSDNQPSYNKPVITLPPPNVGRQFAPVGTTPVKGIPSPRQATTFAPTTSSTTIKPLQFGPINTNTNTNTTDRVPPLGNVPAVNIGRSMTISSTMASRSTTNINPTKVAVYVHPDSDGSYKMVYIIRSGIYTSFSIKVKYNSVGMTSGGIIITTSPSEPSNKYIKLTKERCSNQLVRLTRLIRENPVVAGLFKSTEILECLY